MKFVSDDGKLFETAKECIDYEKSKDFDPSGKEKRANEINKLIKKHVVFSDKLDNMIKSYAKDYPENWDKDLDIQSLNDCRQEDVDVFDAARRGLIALMIILEMIADDDDE